VTTVPCKGCGKPIVWATLAEGDEITSKRVPLDPRPPVYVLQDGVPGEGALCRRVGKAGTAIELLVSHFATCPKANDFSGGGRKA